MNSLFSKIILKSQTRPIHRIHSTLFHLKPYSTRLSTMVAPPIAKKVAYQHEYHAEKRDDPYHWMKDQNPSQKRQEIIDYLNEENEYCKKVHLEPNQKLTDKIYEEIISRIQEDDSSVPVFKDPYWYYSRTEKGKQYSIYGRKKHSMEATEEILLNQNEFSYEYQSLGVFRVSPDHKVLSYSIDLDGSEKYTVIFKDLVTGKEIERIENTGGDVEWFSDSKTVWYNTLDDIHRSDKIFRHVLGTPQSQDALVFHEQDQKFSVYFGVSQSKEYLFLTTTSSLTNEAHFIRTDSPTDKLQVIHPREFRHKYHVEHQGERFIILTDRAGKTLNYELCSAPVSAPEVKNWAPVIPYDPYKHLLDVVPFENFIVLHECFDGMKAIRVLKARDGIIDKKAAPYYLSFEDPIYTVRMDSASAQSYGSSSLRFTYSSPIAARQFWSFDMASKERHLLKATAVPGGFDPSAYVVKRVYAPIPSSTKVDAPFNTPVQDKIPISVIYRKDTFKSDGTNPCLLYGYGSYGISIDPEFSSSRFSLIDRGFVYAIAHIRGGGDCGRGWYETGKFKYKKNTFTDFIAAAERLVEEGLTKPEKLAIEGRSAGGLLMGAVLNFKPDVCKVAVAGVPFVDVINTMMDPSIPLTVNEYEEWGNPNEKDYFDYMLSYSPYENLSTTAKYPDLLVKAGLNDPRVAYWEPSKYVAKLRDLQAGRPESAQSHIVYDCKMGSGHFGSSGRYAYLKEIAADYAFVVERILGESARP